MSNNDVVKRVLQSKNFKNITPEVVERMGREIGDEKKIKSKLHQIWGAYYSTRPKFNKLIKKLEKGETSVLEIAKIHSSTSERLEDFKQFYNFIFDNIEPIDSIYDLGSGFNPLLMLSIEKKWKSYICEDIDIAQQEFLSSVFRMNKRGDMEAKVGDGFSVNIKADLVLLLKLLPTLDRQKKNGAREVLSRICARYYAVSFPSSTIGGRNVGMGRNYPDIYKPIFNELSLKIIGEKEFSKEILFVLENKNRT